MAKKTAHPYCVWRAGRPRFNPPQHLRAEGHAARDLKHADGRWFTFGEMVDWARAFAAARRAPRPPRARRPVPRAAFVALSQLLERFLASPRLAGETVTAGRKVRAGLKASTARYYRNGARLLAARPEADEPLSGLDAAGCVALVDAVERRHGLAQARCARATLQAALKWGRAAGILKADPMVGAEFDLPSLPPRVRPESVAGFLAFMAAAEAEGRPEIADMAALAVFHGQRQNDRLAATWRLMEGDAIGWRQGKRRERRDGEDGADGQAGLVIWINPMLAARLAAARERRKALRVQHPHLVLDERANAPWRADWYRHVFAAVRARAAAAVPALATLRDQDWRDTALSWAEAAGCSRAEIAALSGHAFGRQERVLRHYVAVDPSTSRRAAEKVWSWFEAERARLDRARCGASH